MLNHVALHIALQRHCVRWGSRVVTHWLWCFPTYQSSHLFCLVPLRLAVLSPLSIQPSLQVCRHILRDMLLCLSVERVRICYSCSGVSVFDSPPIPLLLHRSLSSQSLPTFHSSAIAQITLISVSPYSPFLSYCTDHSHLSLSLPSIPLLLHRPLSSQ